MAKRVAATYFPGAMILWLSILILTVAVVALGLWPLMRGGARASALDHAIAFYEDRRLELDRLESEGQISLAERKAAEAEQARRLIAINRDATSIAARAAVGVARRRKLAALLFILAVPAIALGLYLKLGAPGLPDQPLVARKADPQVVALLDAVRQIEQHLARNPDDGRGHEVVAPVYLRAGRFEDAARAYARVVELLGETPERLADLGESRTAAAGGTVTPEARSAFERSIALAPDFAKSRFYLALATEQGGDAAKAYADLIALAAALPESGPRERVVGEIERMRAEGKVPAGAALPPPAPSVGGPASEAGRAVAALPDADREAAIRGMVAGLAARLEQSGGSFEEWYRLIQARLVLGERDKAIEHLAAARKAHASDATMIERLDGVAKAFRLTEQP